MSIKYEYPSSADQEIDLERQKTFIDAVKYVVTNTDSSDPDIGEGDRHPGTFERSRELEVNDGTAQVVIISGARAVAGVLQLTNYPDDGSNVAKRRYWAVMVDEITGERIIEYEESVEPTDISDLDEIRSDFFDESLKEQDEMTDRQIKERALELARQEFPQELHSSQKFDQARFDDAMAILVEAALQD